MEYIGDFPFGECRFARDTHDFYLARGGQLVVLHLPSTQEHWVIDEAIPLYAFAGSLFVRRHGQVQCLRGGQVAWQRAGNDVLAYEQHIVIRQDIIGGSVARQVAWDTGAVMATLQEGDRAAFGMRETGLLIFSYSGKVHQCPWETLGDRSTHLEIPRMYDDQGERIPRALDPPFPVIHDCPRDAADNRQRCSWDRRFRRAPDVLWDMRWRERRLGVNLLLLPLPRGLAVWVGRLAS